MYLIRCRECKTEFSKEATLCPQCGLMHHYVRVCIDAEYDQDHISIKSGETVLEFP